VNLDRPAACAWLPPPSSASCSTSPACRFPTTGFLFVAGSVRGRAGPAGS